MAAEALAVMTYTIPEKKVGWTEQSVSVTVGTLSLYEHEIVAQDQSFPVRSVLDCSHRSFSNGSCLFYLHTDHGVRTFHVSTDPVPFLTAYHRLRGGRL